MLPEALVKNLRQIQSQNISQNNRSLRLRSPRPSQTTPVRRTTRKVIARRQSNSCVDVCELAKNLYDISCCNGICLIISAGPKCRRCNSTERAHQSKVEIEVRILSALCNILLVIKTSGRLLFIS